MLYESAEAGLQAIEDVLQGPDFWREHLDMVERRKALTSMTVIERMRPIDNSAITAATQRALPRRLSNKLAYYLTAKGLLLPRGLFKRQPALTPKTYGVDRYALFRFEQALYLSQKGQSGFVATYDKARFLTIMLRATKLRRTLLRRFDQLSSDYRQGYEELTSRAHWQAVYREEPS